MSPTRKYGQFIIYNWRQS